MVSPYFKEIVKQYIDISEERIAKALIGELQTRPMNKPIYDPKKAGNKLTTAPWNKPSKSDNINQLKVLDQKGNYSRENY